MQLNPYKVGVIGIALAVVASGVLSRSGDSKQTNATALTTSAPLSKPVAEPESKPATAMPLRQREGVVAPKPLVPDTQKGANRLLPPGVDGTTFNGAPIAAPQQPPSLREARRAAGIPEDDPSTSSDRR